MSDVLDPNLCDTHNMDQYMDLDRPRAHHSIYFTRPFRDICEQIGNNLIPLPMSSTNHGARAPDKLFFYYAILRLLAHGKQAY